MTSPFPTRSFPSLLLAAVILSAVLVSCSGPKKAQAPKEKDNKAEDCDCCTDPPGCPAPEGNTTVNPTTIVYDFRSKQISFPDDCYNLRRGDAIRVKVIHYNPFLYQVNIDGRDSSYKAVVDNNNLLSSFMSLANLNNIVAGLGQAATVSSAVANAPRLQQADHFIQLIPSGRETPPTKEDKEAKQKKDALAAACRESMNTLATDHTARILKNVKAIRDQRDKIVTNLVNWDHFFAPQRYLYPTCAEFKVLAGKAETLLTDFTGIQTDITKLYKDIIKDQQEYLKAAADCNAAIRDKDNPDLFQKDSVIQAFYKAALSTIGTLDSALGAQPVIALRQTADRMKDVTPCYTSGPIFLQDNSRIVNIGMNPWNDSFRLPHYPPASFEVPWTQRTVFGISGGLYWAGLHSEQYSVVTVDSAHHSIAKNGTGSGELGIDALAYFGFAKLSKNQKDYSYFGASCGAGLSLESSPKPRGLFGLSYINGRTNRILVTLGVIGGFTNQLSDVYQVNTNIGAMPTGVTKSQLKASIFLSLNYSFLN